MPSPHDDSYDSIFSGELWSSIHCLVRLSSLTAMDLAQPVEVHSYTAYVIQIGETKHHVPAGLVKLDSNGEPMVAMRASNYKVQQIFGVNHTLANCQGFKSIQEARNIACGVMDVQPDQPGGDQLFDEPAANAKRPRKRARKDTGPPIGEFVEVNPSEGVTIKVKAAMHPTDDIVLPLLDIANLQAFLQHVVNLGVETSSRLYTRTGKWVGHKSKPMAADAAVED